MGDGESLGRQPYGLRAGLLMLLFGLLAGCTAAAPPDARQTTADRSSSPEAREIRPTPPLQARGEAPLLAALPPAAEDQGGASPAQQVSARFTGLASWYGKRFHGRTTASGVPFDMTAMTAAHRSLPFGTRVRVINQANQRSVVVTINDRGPFIKGRVIDLSRAAARQLAFIDSGVTNVRVEVLATAAPN